MSSFATYATKYQHMKMERRNGILQLTLHSDDQTLRWGGGPHAELGPAFRDISADPETQAIILTGTGSAFIEEIDANTVGQRLPKSQMSPRVWDGIYWDAKQLLMNLLDIEVPMIAAVNGPVNIHAELAVLCDIVLAAEHATFQDAPHFPNGLVPGDGVHVVWPLVLGINRGRYFLLTGQKLSAQDALQLGVVSEVLPADHLVARAWELAEQIVKQPPLTLRYARVVFTQRIKQLLLDNLGYGLALQGLAANEYWPPS